MSEIIYNTYEDLYDKPVISSTLLDDCTLAPWSETPPDTIMDGLGAFHKVFDSNEPWMLSDFIDKMPHGIVDKQLAGIGATTLEIRAHRNSIIVFPTKVLAYNKTLKHPDALYVGSEIGYYQSTKIDTIKHYIDSDSPAYKKILVVADSVVKVVEAVGVEHLDNYFYMVDEIDLLQDDSNYRPQLENVMDYYFLFPVKSRCLVSATINDFSNPKLQNECKFNIDWRFSPKREISLILTENLNGAIAKCIEQHSEDKVFIAYNSIINILNIISNLPTEKQQECSILCSEASISEAGNFYSRLTSDNKLPSRITFATCCYFTGIDIEDTYHLITVSNAKKSYQILSFNRITQIYGRCRVENGVHSETIIYSTRSYIGGSTNTEAYRNLLLLKASKVGTLIDNAESLKGNTPELIDLLDVVKEQIMVSAKEKVIGEEPLVIVRKDAWGNYVPAYLNIDYLVEKQKTLLLYNTQNRFLKELSKRHKITHIVDTTPILQDQKQAEEGNVNDYLQELDRHINMAIDEVKELENNGLLTDEELDKKIRKSKRNAKLFYERFKKLHNYTNTESITTLLYECRAKDSRVFKHINNGLFFWALSDEHPLKMSIRAAFKVGERYTATEIREKMTPIVKYHFFRSLRPRRYVSLFKSFYLCDRPRSQYLVISENPFDFSSHKVLVPPSDNNLLKYFVI